MRAQTFDAVVSDGGGGGGGAIDNWRAIQTLACCSWCFAASKLITAACRAALPVATAAAASSAPDLGTCLHGQEHGLWKAITGYRLHDKRFLLEKVQSADKSRVITLQCDVLQQTPGASPAAGC
jgi:hypothetical protein